MTQFLLSLDELERVKRLNGIKYTSELPEITGVSRSTWSRAIRTQEVSPTVLQALAQLGARPNRIIIADTEESRIAA